MVGRYFILLGVQLVEEVLVWDATATQAQCDCLKAVSGCRSGSCGGSIKLLQPTRYFYAMTCLESCVIVRIIYRGRFIFLVRVNSIPT